MKLATRTLAVFNHDWDQEGYRRAAQALCTQVDGAGFDLFSFPSNARLAWFDVERFVAGLASQARRKGWSAVVSNQEQFGALTAAVLAERMGWPGTPVKAVMACQHKLYARQVLQRVAPEANVPFQLLDTVYGAPVPEGLSYPVFVKPVKAAFSVLARQVESHADLHAHTRFGAWELWVIRHLVEPFERLVHRHLGPDVPSSHRLMLEAPVHADQFNLDGYVFNGQCHALGVVDALMYPGTQAFMRFQLPSRLPDSVQAQALDVARRFLAEVGFTHGLFNMEFFYDDATGDLKVIEFNPRMASQFSDLYLQVRGVCLHEVSLALAHGRDPADLPQHPPTAGAAASFVQRVFDPQAPVSMPCAEQLARFATAFPQGLVMQFPRSAGSIARDFKWLGSYRYGIVHLAGATVADMLDRYRHACSLLGWPATAA